MAIKHTLINHHLFALTKGPYLQYYGEELYSPLPLAPGKERRPVSSNS